MSSALEAVSPTKELADKAIDARATLNFIEDYDEVKSEIEDWIKFCICCISYALPYTCKPLTKEEDESLVKWSTYMAEENHLQTVKLRKKAILYLEDIVLNVDFDSDPDPDSKMMTYLINNGYLYTRVIEGDNFILMTDFGLKTIS